MEFTELTTMPFALPCVHAPPTSEAFPRIAVPEASLKSSENTTAPLQREAASNELASNGINRFFLCFIILIFVFWFLWSFLQTEDQSTMIWHWVIDYGVTIGSFKKQTIPMNMCNQWG